MEFVIGGIAASTAGFFTNPIEVVKHQMELSKKCQFDQRYQYIVHKGFKAATKEGFKSMQKGLSLALGAHLIGYGIKLGTYQIGRNHGTTKDANGRTIVLNSLATSTVGGLLGQFMSNPFYMLKAKHYAEAGNNHGTYSDTAKRIYREQGVRGFFRGATTSVPRAVIGTSQLTSYAVTKDMLHEYDLFVKHPVFETVTAGFVAGVVLSLSMTPFETVLSNMYGQAVNPNSNNARYSGYLDCIKKIYKANGCKPFFKGTSAIYAKMGPHTALCLVFWEEMTEAYGKEDSFGLIKSNNLEFYNNLLLGTTTDFNGLADVHARRASLLYY